MRTTFTVTVILLFNVSTLGQSPVQNGRCPPLDNNAIDIYIAGFRDTIQPNGLKARIIDASSLVNGFELLSNDSLVTIRGYHLVFDDPKGTLYSKSTQSSKMLDNEQHIVPLQKIKEATLITIDNITVEYRGLCYKIKSQLYYAQ